MNQHDNTLKEFFLTNAQSLSNDQNLTIQTSKQIEKLKEQFEQHEQIIEWHPIYNQILEKIVELLDIKMKDIMAGAWKKYEKFQKYLEKSKYEPDETLLLPLAEHTIKSEHHPYVEIDLNDRKIDEIKLHINIKLELKGVVLTIKEGRITQIETGNCKGSGTVKLGEIPILKREFDEVKLPGKIVIEQEKIPEEVM